MKVFDLMCDLRGRGVPFIPNVFFFGVLNLDCGVAYGGGAWERAASQSKGRVAESEGVDAGDRCRLMEDLGRLRGVRGGTGLAGVEILLRWRTDMLEVEGQSRLAYFSNTPARQRDRDGDHDLWKHICLQISSSLISTRVSCITRCYTQHDALFNTQSQYSVH
jgi:hypothetical protein